MENDQGRASEQEQRRWHRQWLSEEFVALGPARFVETLGVVRDVALEGAGVNEIPLRCSARGIEMSKERFSHFLFGYMDDQNEWDAILERLDKNGGV